MRRTLLLGLLRPALTERAPRPDDDALAELAARVDRAARSRLGRSLAIREVDAGSCNGCELEIHALNNAYYDLERFGIRFVASPRHADVLLVTGPVTKNMREALWRTYQATPEPKWVVAVGDCAFDGGLFAASYAVAGGVSAAVPAEKAHRAVDVRPHRSRKAFSVVRPPTSERWRRNVGRNDAGSVKAPCLRPTHAAGFMFEPRTMARTRSGKRLA